MLESELPALTREVVEAIAQEVPEYVRPLEGAFGVAVQTGVEQALRRFAALIRDPDSGEEAREVYFALGRGEYRQGRTLDALQAAYRVGARVSWRRFARASQAAGLEPDSLAILAEAIFAYIDGISADSVDGYAQAQSELAGERERRREDLLAALMGGATEAEVALLAAAAGWRAPRSAATLACTLPRLSGLARRLGPDVLAAPFEGKGCVIVSDAEGPRRREALRVAARGRRVALGPIVPIDRLSTSWHLATAALAIAASDDGLIVADEQLTALLLGEASPVVERIATLRLAALDGLTPNARLRMRETALAYVQHHGNATAMAGALHLHPQSARYRIARLRELLGEELLDPDTRFELEAALRATER